MTPDFMIPEMTIPIPEIKKFSWISNIAGSFLVLMLILSLDLSLSLYRNYLSSGSPFPETFESSKMGQIVLIFMFLAQKLISFSFFAKMAFFLSFFMHFMSFFFVCLKI